MENDSQKITVTCPLQCVSEVVVFTVKNGSTIRRCNECKLLFVWPIPIDCAQVYSEDYFQGASHGFGYADYDNDKEAMRDTFIKYLEYIEKNKNRPGRLLDVGAATGFFLSIAKERGWEVAGVELSDFAAEQGRKKGMDIRTGTLSSTDFAPNSFDVITMWDVIEHVTDPAAELTEVWKLLKPSGIVAINTPDSGSWLARILGRHWHLLVPPEHLFYFNKHNFGALLASKHFTVIDSTKFNKKFTISYIYKTVTHWKPWLSGSLLRRLFEKTALARVSIPLYLGDNFFTMAKKPDQL